MMMMIEQMMIELMMMMIGGDDDDADDDRIDYSADDDRISTIIFFSSFTFYIYSQIATSSLNDTSECDSLAGVLLSSLFCRYMDANNINNVTDNHEVGSSYLYHHHHHYHHHYCITFIIIITVLIPIIRIVFIITMNYHLDFTDIINVRKLTSLPMYS